MPRKVTNTYYKVQIDQVQDESISSLKVEEGAVIQVNGDIFVGVNGSWEQLYLNIGQQLGWGRFDDDQYNAGSPFTFLANTEFVVPNNSASIEYVGDGYRYYDSSIKKIQANNKNDTFLVTIAFKAYLDSNNEHVEIYFDGGGTTPYTRIKDIIVFPKGNGVEHEYAKTFQYYADTDVVLNGLEVKMKASTTGAIYDVIYFIQQVQKYGA